MSIGVKVNTKKLTLKNINRSTFVMNLNALSQIRKAVKQTAMTLCKNQILFKKGQEYLSQDADLPIPEGYTEIEKFNGQFNLLK